jgi:formylmethanofuran dehydrogenase subunit D
MNLDLVTGERFSLPAVFIPRADWVNRIAEVAPDTRGHA